MPGSNVIYTEIDLEPDSASESAAAISKFIHRRRSNYFSAFIRLTIMKFRLFTLVFILLDLALFTDAKPSQAQSRFSCDTANLSTMVQTERGSVPLLRWVDRSFPPPYTPEQRCEIVSGRFRKFDNNGTLKYIRAAEINNLPVLCIAAYQGGSCLPDGLLVTFKPGTDAERALVKILDYRVWAAGGSYRLDGTGGNNQDGSARVVSRVEGKTYVDLELFLNWTDSSQ